MKPRFYLWFSRSDDTLPKRLVCDPFGVARMFVFDRRLEGFVHSVALTADFLLPGDVSCWAEISSEEAQRWATLYPELGSIDARPAPGMLLVPTASLW